MKTVEVEAMLLRHLGVRTHIVVPNVSWGIQHNRKSLHECDMLSLSKSGYATEYEIKISKKDLLADKKKSHKHEHALIKYLYFVVPEKLREDTLLHAPRNAGVITVDYTHNRFDVVREAKMNKECVKWTDKQRLHLAHLGCMRLVLLKEDQADRAIQGGRNDK